MVHAERLRQDSGVQRETALPKPDHAGNRSHHESRHLVDNAKGHFAYITVGGENKVLVYTRDVGASTQLVATIPTGDLPHGIWGSEDGNRAYIGLENGDAVQAIDTATNRIIATIPVGQLPQALVYVPGATTDDTGTANLKPLGPATEALHLELVPPAKTGTSAHASVSINSLGLIDNLQIAAAGLEPGKKYQLVLVGGPEPQGLVGGVLTAGIGGVSIAQSLGPLKRIATGSHTSPAMRLELRSGSDGKGGLVLKQAE